MTMPLAGSTRLTALLLGGLLGLALSPAAPARDDTPAEIAALTNPVTLEPRDVRYYARQFRGKCARCHGPDGAGGGEEAAEQAVPPANFTDAAFMSTRSDGQLFYQILMGGGERCAMPAFGPESSHGWSEDKIWHMVAFVRRFAAPPSE
jgi:mono/diheme cytochrome c family protein